ncbi:MAG: hypothetical protein AB7M05_07135 [Alphaproteobacteria bacterium]
MAYTGKTFRGVDYSPTWPSWSQGPGGTQTNDSDFANDAFASFWSDKFRAPPAGGGSVPVNNGTTYRNDLATMQQYGFNLVRLYNWDMARGTNPPSPTGPSPDHINFLDHAYALGIKVVVPVSDYFLGDNQYAWNNAVLSSYAFSQAPPGIQNDFGLFVASITDPRTNKIHAAVHSISIGNEGDIGQGIAGTTASNFLARTIWWIVNLRQKIMSFGPNVMLSATFSNADQGGSTGSWFNCLISGVMAQQQTPNGCALGANFATAVTGLKAADPTYATYYYNSTNIGQNGTGLTQTLGFYDSGASPWPGAAMNVPLLFMEVFTNNRNQYPDANFPTQAAAALNRINALEAYLKTKNAGSSVSATWLMGYNYFEFNDEPSQPKTTGLFSYYPLSNSAQTGTTSTWYSTTFPNYAFNVHSLIANPGPTAAQTLPVAIQAAFPGASMSGSIVATFGAPGDWQATFYSGSPVPSGIKAGMFASGPGIPPGAVVLAAPLIPAPTMTVVMVCRSNAAANPFTAQGTVTLTFRA